MDGVFEALGDPTRRRILQLLSAGEQPAGALVTALGSITQPAVSQHLKVLREADLVAFTPDGARHVYQVRPDGLAALRADLDRFWRTALENFQRIARDIAKEES